MSNIYCLPSGRFHVSRPEVLHVLIDVTVVGADWCVDCLGTRDQLLQCGIAHPEWFNLGTSTQRTGVDEFGDRYVLRRRAREKWDLGRRFKPELFGVDPSPAAAATAVILARFER